MIQSGRFFFIDCLQTPQLSLVDAEHPPLDSFEALTGRVVVAKHRWLSQQSKPSPATSSSSAASRPRFSVAVDDLTLLADMWAGGLPAPALAFARALLALARDPAHTLGLSLSAPAPAHTLHPGSLYLCTTPPVPAHGFLTATSAAPAPPAAPTPAQLLQATRHRDKEPAAQYVDVGVGAGGLAGLVAHWALAAAGDAPGQALELRALSSGYSRDVYAELHVRVGARADAVDACVRAAVSEGQRTQALMESLSGRGAVVYLSVGGDGSLLCHTRG